MKDMCLGICRTFQMLGLQGLGSSGGFERLHYLLEAAFDGEDLSMAFMKVMPMTVNFLHVGQHLKHLTQAC